MNKTLAVIIGLSFLMRLILAFQPVDILIKKIMLDDSFYGFEIAKNMALGLISYNGYELSNGVQPLWSLIVSQLFNIGNGVQLALLASAVIDTMAAFLFYRIAHRFFSEKMSLAAFALYGLNPLIAMTTISGIDVILAVFFVAFISYIYFCGKSRTLLGVALGLGMLARADMILLFVPISALLFFSERKNWLRVSAIAILIFAPWLVWSFVNFGTIQQSSGIANYLHAHGVYEEKMPEYSFSDFLSIGGTNFVKLSGFLFHYFGAIDFSVSSLSIAGICSLLALYGFLKNRKFFFPIAVYALLIISFYSLYLWSYGPRYITPLVGFVSILISVGVFNILAKLRAEKIFAPIVILFLLAFSSLGLIQWQKGYFPWQTATLDEVDWIKNNTNASDVIGSFNSGIITYFSKNKVINLDGILNFKAIEAIQNRNVYEYIKSENVSYWVDMEFFPPEVFERGENFDVAAQNRWVHVLGQGKENLNLIEEKFYRFKNLRGNNLTIVRFVFKVN